ncbi:glutathione S-transferase [Vespula squamosa]|uniref:Glutathione S-transferase n=1 Tax=Vespula squamosa TaxID=30214 RepID=A0ABD2A283_VESSQ
MPIDLYQKLGSTPCSAVRLTAAAVGVNFNLKETNLMAGDHLKPEFLKMNPQHTIPTMNDNGFYLWESRAIMGYLVDQYGKSDSLYPKDAKKRAVVNQRLFFDANVLYQSFAEYYYPMIFSGAPKDLTKYEKIEKALEFLDKFLENENYVAGKNMTIADHSITATITNLELIDYDLSKFTNINKWFKRMKSEIVKYDEICLEGIKALRSIVDIVSKKK